MTKKSTTKTRHEHLPNSKCWDGIWCNLDSRCSTIKPRQAPLKSFKQLLCLGEFFPRRNVIPDLVEIQLQSLATIWQSRSLKHLALPTSTHGAISVFDRRPKALDPKPRIKICVLDYTMKNTHQFFTFEQHLITKWGTTASYGRVAKGAYQRWVPKKHQRHQHLTLWQKYLTHNHRVDQQHQCNICL